MECCLKKCVMLVLSLSVIARATDICSSCNCFPYEEDYFVISCKNHKNQASDLDMEEIEWPKNSENLRIKAFFNNFAINSLPKIKGDAKVISVNFDDNNIRTVTGNPLEYFKNLEELSLANNRISALSKDFLKTQTKLKQLNMSNNTLMSIDTSIVANLKELQEISLSHNILSKITAEFFEAACNVEVMRFENNKLYAIDSAPDRCGYKLRKIFLAYNHFTVITSSMFEAFDKLEVIDLSNNKISNVENAFADLIHLKLLDLSNNNIKHVSMRLPNTLELLAINNNKLNSWPLANIPENLAELELSENNLDFIFPNDENVHGLIKLDISRNLIHELPKTQFIKLEYLNLSYNLFKAVPQNINEMAPFLKELILDGNEISQIEFHEPTTLGSISLSNLPLLQKINEFAFSNLSGTHVTFDKSETCLVARISHNENLVEIEPNAFYGVRFCDLDLSYNRLEKIPQNLTDWRNIDSGVNLQGNPIACTCQEEWIIEDIMMALYNNPEQQELLLDLRCQSPDEFRRRRLVQFLNHDNPFCSPRFDDEMVLESGIGNFLPKFVGASDSSQNVERIEFHLTPWSPGFIIIVVLCSLILVLMVIVGVKWQKDQSLKLARRNRLYYDDYY